MGISITQQTMVFLYSVLLGAGLSFFYDLFRILRKRVEHKNFVVMIEDVLFWLIAVIVTFVFVYNANAGQIRAYVLLGAGIGCCLYFLTISKWIIKVLCAIIALLQKIITTVLKIILKPFIIVVRPFYKLSAAASKKSQKYCRNLKNVFQFKAKTVIISLRKNNFKKKLARNKKNK